jgi:hypothetical protein
MLFFGQSLQLPDGTPAVFLGDATNEEVTFVLESGEVKRMPETAVNDVDFLFQKDKSSPTGKSIYYGGLCRYIRYPGVTIKRPTNEQLAAEFKAIKSIKPPK